MSSGVLLTLNSKTRFTEDIEIVNLNFKNDSMTIWEIAQDVGLNIEQVNQAGRFFLSKVSNFRDDCIVYFKGPKLTIFIPNVYLYFQLKLARFSDTDTRDRIEYLELSNASSALDIKRLRELVREHRGSKKNKTLLESHLNRLGTDTDED